MNAFLEPVSTLHMSDLEVSAKIFQLVCSTISMPGQHNSVTALMKPKSF